MLRAIVKKIIITILLLIVIAAVLLGWRVWQGYLTLSKSIEIDIPKTIVVQPGDH